jgi:prepilin-type N-terminal cleavage/methylation domain-containing protein
MSRARQESGFTLVELLVAMVIGSVVLMATFMLLDAATPLAKKTQDRVDAFQRGRLALDIIGADLRSQVCLPNATPPMVSTGTDGSNVWFYNNMGDENSLPQLRHVYLSGTSVKEDMWPGRVDTSPASMTGVAFDTPKQTRTLVSDIALVPGVPLFRYYGFDANLPAAVNQQLAPPLSTDSDAVNYIGKVVQIDVSFVARPSKATAASKRDATFQQSVYFRTADATDPSKGAKCD